MKQKPANFPGLTLKDNRKLFALSDLRVLDSHPLKEALHMLMPMSFSHQMQQKQLTCWTLKDKVGVPVYNEYLSTSNDNFSSCLRFDEESNKWNYLFVIDAISVCCGAFRQIMGIPSSTFYAVRKMFLSMLIFFIMKCMIFNEVDIDFHCFLLFFVFYLIMLTGGDSEWKICWYVSDECNVKIMWGRQKKGWRGWQYSTEQPLSRWTYVNSHKYSRGGPRRVSIYLYLWIQSSSWTKVLVLDSFAGACLLLCITSQVSDVAHGPHFCYFAISFLFKNHVIQYFTNFTCRFCSEFLRNLPNGLRI